MQQDVAGSALGKGVAPMVPVLAGALLCHPMAGPRMLYLCHCWLRVDPSDLQLCYPVPRWQVLFDPQKFCALLKIMGDACRSLSTWARICELMVSFRPATATPI